MTDPLLSVRDLQKHYPITRGVLRRQVGAIRAVDGVTFDVFPGEIVGLVGESGCGKSTVATTVLRLEAPTGGEIHFDGENITDYDAAELKRFRRRVGIIFQDPSSSFDPRMSVGDAVAEPLLIHGIVDADRRRAIVEDLLSRIGLTAADYDRYPHEFSGGQRQRISLARALVVNPDLLVADEPTTALDVSVQAEILRLVSDLQRQLGLAILLISHDMSVIRELCDRVAVMYLGQIVEFAPTEQLFEDPQHPYTRALLSSIPSLDPRQRGFGVELTGSVPSPANPPTGCRFHTRCPEIIQPDGYVFKQPTWRAVMDLRQRLAAGIDLVAAATSDDDVADPPAAVRESFGIPDRLSDPSAERVLASALDLLATGNVDDARALLTAEFATICEQVVPPLDASPAGHPASCHLHDQPTEAHRTELESGETETD